MKKNLSFIALAVAATLVSCQKSGISDNSVKFEKLSVDAALSDTKVAVEGLKMFWTAGDEISICNRLIGVVGNKGQQFTSNISGKSASAVFTGDIPDTLTRIFAIYPYGIVDHWNKGSGTPQAYMVLPADQTATLGSCDPNSAIMYATAIRGESLSFKVLNSFIKFTIGAESPAVKSVTVADATRSYEAWNLEVNPPSISDRAPATAAVNLNSSTVLSQGDYYISVLPEEHASGLSISFKLDDGSIIAKTSAAITLESGTVYPLGVVKGSSIAGFNVGEVYTEGSQKAVVFAVDGDGTHARAITVDRIQCHWAEFLDQIGASSKDDGELNMTTIKTYLDSNPTAILPAYNFCASKGEGWYLPAINELHTLVEAYEGCTYDEAYAHRATSSTLPDDIKAKRAEFDQILIDNGGVAINDSDPVGNGDAYWASTELKYNSVFEYAYQLRMGRLYELTGADSASKTRNGWVRCVKKISK